MIEIIPAIDIIDGRCVRLGQGDYDRCTRYDTSVVEMAVRYENIGIGRIHVVDLDGAKSSAPKNLKLLEDIVSRTALKVEWGGGIKSSESLQSVFDSGAEFAICGSVAVHDPSLFRSWLSEWGKSRIVLGADILNGMVKTHGWFLDGGVSIEGLINSYRGEVEQVVCTDISRDGMLIGPNFDLYASLQTTYPEMIFTVSGGVSSMDDIRKLDRKGIKRVIVGKAIYENKITLKEIKRWLLKG